MPKTKVEIEIEIPDGYEVIDHRCPRAGDTTIEFLASRSEPYVFQNNGCTTPKFIIRKSWQWPDWIKPGTWICHDRGGFFFILDMKPIAMEEGWRLPGTSFGASCVRCIVDFPLPPLSADWRQSARQKPLE